MTRGSTFPFHTRAHDFYGQPWYPMSVDHPSPDNCFIGPMDNAHLGLNLWKYNKNYKSIHQEMNILNIWDSNYIYKVSGLSDPQSLTTFLGLASHVMWLLFGHLTKLLTGLLCAIMLYGNAKPWDMLQVCVPEALSFSVFLYYKKENIYFFSSHTRLLHWLESFLRDEWIPLYWFT